MDKRYLSRVAVYLLLGIFAIAIVCELCYQFYDSAYESVETVDAVKRELTLTADGVGIIVRDETVINGDDGCFYSYLASDGEKVSSGQTVARMSAESDEVKSAQSEIDALTDEINCLEKAQSAAYGYSVASIETAIAELRSSIVVNAADGNLSELNTKTDELSVLLAASKIVRGDVKNYNDKIAALEKEIDELEKSIITTGKVKSPKSGYFYSSTDGCEQIISVDDIDTMTLDDCEKAVELVRDRDGVDSNDVGKVVGSFDWYSVCIVDNDPKYGFSEGKTYTVVFGQTETTMTLFRIIKSDGSDKIALVFKSELTADGFDYSRLQQVSVVYDSVYGYDVPSEAVHIEDGVSGVYVLHGNVVEFREIKSVYCDCGIFFSEDGFEASDGKTALSFYDLIIVRGKDLYVGKIVS